MATSNATTVVIFTFFAVHPAAASLPLVAHAPQCKGHVAARATEHA
jgi:hypothetical protein